MLIVTIVLGFGMMTLGVALLFLGEAPFVAGRRIPALRARLIGGVLVGFLPAAWAIWAVLDWLFPYAVEGPVVTALTFSLCCLLIIVILFRVMVPKGAPREPRKAAPAGFSKPNPFGDMDPGPVEPAPEPVKPPTGKKSRKASAGESNPFDFG